MNAIYAVDYTKRVFRINADAGSTQHVKTAIENR